MSGNVAEHTMSELNNEKSYYAKHIIMMIMMIMVMDVHNLFSLSVKTILMQTGGQWVNNVPLADNDSTLWKCFMGNEICLLWKCFMGNETCLQQPVCRGLLDVHLLQ